MGKKTVTVVGALLVVLGVISLVWGGVEYTQREDVIELGDLELEAKTEEEVPLPPIVGVLALGGGILLLVFGARRGAS